METRSLVPSTLRELTSGSRLTFTPRGELERAGVAKPLGLAAAS